MHAGIKPLMRGRESGGSRGSEREGSGTDGGMGERGAEGNGWSQGQGGCMGEEWWKGQACGGAGNVRQREKNNVEGRKRDMWAGIEICGGYQPRHWEKGGIPAEAGQGYGKGDYCGLQRCGHSCVGFGLTSLAGRARSVRSRGRVGV